MIRKQKRVSKTSLLLLLIVKDLNKAIFHLVIREEAVSSGNGKIFFFFFFFVTPNSVQDLSFPTRNQTWAMTMKAPNSDHEGIPWSDFL